MRDANRVKTLEIIMLGNSAPHCIRGTPGAIRQERERRGGLELMPRRPRGNVAVSNDDRVAADARKLTAVVYLRTAAAFLCAGDFFMRWRPGNVVFGRE